MSENQIQLTKSLADFNQLIQFANYLCKSEALPATYKNSANVLVALQTGKEMGLEPMQSLRMLYIVSGNIKPWGTAYPYFLKRAGFKIEIGKHDREICEVTAIKGDEVYSYTATRTEIKPDSKAMGFAPKEKLYFHACSRIINYYLPELMAGMNFDNQVDDFISSDTNSSPTEEPAEEISELQYFIEHDVRTLEALMSVQSRLETEKEKNAFVKKLSELKEEEPSDGALLEDKKPTTDV